jgi:hypothetical protein
VLTHPRRRHADRIGDSLGIDETTTLCPIWGRAFQRHFCPRWGRSGLQALGHEVRQLHQLIRRQPHHQRFTYNIDGPEFRAGFMAQVSSMTIEHFASRHRRALEHRRALDVVGCATHQAAAFTESGRSPICAS